MKRSLVFLMFLTVWAGSLSAAQTGKTVSWSIGSETFTWTFDRDVTWGHFLDSTIWAMEVPGLQLVSVSPAKTTENIPAYDGQGAQNWMLDGTVINPQDNAAGWDARLQTYSAPVTWDGNAVTVTAGDMITTAKSKRANILKDRDPCLLAMAALCIVTEDKSDEFRPPLVMDPAVRKKLDLTYTVPAASSLPRISMVKQQDLTGVEYSSNVFTGFDNSDDLVRGAAPHLYADGADAYRQATADYNQDVTGNITNGYHFNISQRQVSLLYTAFATDPRVSEARKQNALVRFCQQALDYYYCFAQGYGLWALGGGHITSVEDVISLGGAILGSEKLVNSIKHQHWDESALDASLTPVDQWDYSATGNNYGNYISISQSIVLASPWKSGTFYQRTGGTYGTDLETYINYYDMADTASVMNLEGIPYTDITDDGEYSWVQVDPAYQWPMFAVNYQTDKSQAKRSYSMPADAAVRLSGDQQIRQVLSFKQDTATAWTDGSFETAEGKGGVLLVYPAVPAGINRSGTLTTGLATQQTAPRAAITREAIKHVIDKREIDVGFSRSPNKAYTGIRIGCAIRFAPFYKLLDDPTAPGKKMSEENATFRTVKAFMDMMKKSGFYPVNATLLTTPNWPTAGEIKNMWAAAFTEYVWDGEPLGTAPGRTYAADDKMWNEVPLGIGDRFTGIPVVKGPSAPPGRLFTIRGAAVGSGGTRAGIYLMQDKTGLKKVLLLK